MLSKLEVVGRSKNTLSIAGKTRLLFGAMGAVAILITAAGLAGLVWLYSSTQAFEQVSHAALDGSGATSAFAQAQSHAKHFVVSGDPSELAAAKEGLAAARTRLESLHNPANSGLDARLKGLKEAADRLEERITAYSAPGWNGAVENIPVEMDRLTFAGDAFFSQAKSMNGDISGKLDGIGKNVLTGLTINIAAIAFLGLAAIAVAVVAMRNARKHISAPIERITGAMRHLVEGETHADIPETGRSDEIGDLARGIQVFKDNTEKIERLQLDAAQAARKELELKAEQEREREQNRALQAAMFAELADRFERTVGEVVGSVASASSQLRATASTMAASAEQSSLRTSEVSASLGEASANVTAAASSSDEFALSISEISRQAANSAELARHAAKSTSEADATIAGLSASTGEIGKIVELISSIAQRTNLLALNASIEAARGESAGRGFAVVAAEVKELATRTGQATDEVADKIRSIELTTRATIAALEAVAGHVAKLETASVSIASAVDQQSVAGHDLAQNIDHAARHTDEVSSSIVEVRDASLANGAAASQLLASSSDLEELAGALSTQVSEFLGHVRNA